MIIPVPERFAPKWVAAFAATLLLVQLIEGTDPIFALLCFLYVCIFSFAFNLSGGIYYPSGAYIFFNGLLTTIVGISYKAFLLGEPGQTHMLVPNTTLVVYCVGMALLGLCGYLSRLTRTRRGLLETTSQGEQLKKTAIGCLLIGLFFQFAPLGGLQSIVAQLNHFPRMAVILGTVYAIESTRGRRSSNWVVWAAGIYLTGLGLAYFSKEGIFMALTTWIVPAVVLRFNFSKGQLVLGAVFVAFGLYYLVPYSQYGRLSRDENGSLYKSSLAGIEYLKDLNGTRRLYLESLVGRDIDNAPHLYDRDEGLFDRLEMLSVDDALIKYTQDGNTVGLIPTLASIYNAVPHVLWKDKPTYVAGNVYGREIGVLDSDDLTTSISFSPVADAFHQEGWSGVILLLPLTIFPLFYVADSLSGDVRKAPWGLLYIALFVHYAPEGMLAGAVYILVYGSEGVIFVTLLARYVLPTVTTLLAGGGKAAARPSMNFRPAKRPGTA